jgi:hypothetical protein
VDRTDNAVISERMAVPSDLPDEIEPELDEPRFDHSLLDDLDALVTDGKTYLEAELAYQKSRAAFSANRVKWSFVYGAAAFGLLHLALIALAVGAVIALTPLVGPWLATGLVVIALLALALFFILRLKAKLGDIRDVFEDRQP